MSRVVRACVTFVLLYAGFQLVVDGLPAGSWDWLVRSTAWTSWVALRAIGAEVTLDGRFLTSPRFSLEVIRECTALQTILLFLAAVLAHPAGFRAKLAGVLLGVPSLVVINILRVVSLFLLGQRRPEAVEIVHVVVWQSLLVFAVVLLWIVWAHGPARRHVPSHS